MALFHYSIDRLFHAGGDSLCTSIHRGINCWLMDFDQPFAAMSESGDESNSESWVNQRHRQGRYVICCVRTTWSTMFAQRWINGQIMHSWRSLFCRGVSCGESWTHDSPHDPHRSRNAGSMGESWTLICPLLQWAIQGANQCDIHW
jgi:hypothetical protein